jgi:uncharacterized repeat protein (TIGR03803 family)
VTKLSWWKTAGILFVFCAATAIASPAQILTTLHSFNYTDGQGPGAVLVQASDGNFYGTTPRGGVNDNGTLFKMTPSGTLTTLHDFCAQSTHGDCVDGQGPGAALVQASDGNFYGTTPGGGVNRAGTVFKITPNGALTTLHSFDGTDGASPAAGLVQTSGGDLYGTTYSGGANGWGTVYKITLSGTLTTLYSFCAQSGCTDGARPGAGLVQANDGNLYGTTSSGGASGYGTVFKFTLNGTLITLNSFCSQGGCPNGLAPSGLVQASDGNFYAMTNRGGADNSGTVFKITPSGTLTTIYSFCSLSGCADGEWPTAGLVQASDGNFYGTTQFGGTSGYGIAFKITPSGTLTTLYNFCSQSGCSDGLYPLAGLVQASDGNFYGTTEYGGVNGNNGTVFRLTLLPPCLFCRNLE